MIRVIRNLRLKKLMTWVCLTLESWGSKSCSLRRRTTGFGTNIVRSGAFVFRAAPVPDSGQTFVLLGIGMGLTLGLGRRLRLDH